MRKSVGSFIVLNRRAFFLLGILLSIAVFGVISWRASAQNRNPADQQQSNVISGKSYQNDTSIPLRDMKPDPYLGKPMDREANENPKIPHKHADVPDEA